MNSYPRIPINPCLSFGDSLEKVCTGGRLHPGLKELFTKAYFSAHQSECLFFDEDSSETKHGAVSPGAWLMTILKFAQGTVAVRLALKSRLEKGRWLLPLQVPPAAPLWLIRHFLGRLPTPLILSCADAKGTIEKCRRKWLRLSTDCQIAMHKLAYCQKLHGPLQKRLALALDDMMLEAYLMLVSLITLIRNLSYEDSNGWIDGEAVTALVEYFTPSVISRPYRPGYLTKDDKGMLAALQYLCFNLPEVRALCKTSVAEPRVRFSIDSPTYSSILRSSKKFGTPPALKKVTIDDLKQIFTTAVSPGLQNHQPQAEHKHKENISSKESPMDLDNEIKERITPHQVTGDFASPTLDSSKNLQHDSPPNSSKASDYVDKKKEPLCIGKAVITPQVLFLPDAHKEKELQNDIISLGDMSKSEEKIFNGTSTTNKKCQAVKLAYKLRGQWLAWRLAGLFIDGATSPISGIGYSKLYHD